MPTSAVQWHALGASEALARVDGHAEGLDGDEARRRLAHFGPNVLPEPRRRSALARFVAQFHNVLIYILAAAGAITAFLGHWVDSAVIFGVVLANALIGYVQEGKAENAIEGIRRLLSLSATVLRDGRRQSIAAEALVPGDIVLLASGDKVPADLRLLRLRSLRIEEAALTGESVPVEKKTEPAPADAALGERWSIAYSGTLVTYGQATGVVIATGAHTEIGRISRVIAEVETLATPLMRKIAAFGKRLSVAILALAAAAFAFGVLLRGYSASEMFLAAVGIAVAAIPEGLPAIVTITLAIGVQRMARRSAIVRRLPAVESLGSVTVICTDKTGTLTRNEMAVQRLVTARAALEVTGDGYAPEGEILPREAAASVAAEIEAVSRIASLCNDACIHPVDGAWRVDGDPTEGALLALAHKCGTPPREWHERLPRIDAIPFESEHRFMATLHHDGADAAYILVKGAPERVLEMCSGQLAGAAAAALDRGYWLREMDAGAAAGMRMLMLAMRRVEGAPATLGFEDVESGLCLVALAGIIDPPREEAIAAVADCRSAGVRVKMITGDHAVTARAIGERLGLAAAEALTGRELESLDAGELSEAASRVDVFARASPENKLALVQALQARGEIVAMTGDGVNDAPALKRADIGVAMGLKGTEAAKEAAEMVLADDNFASIAHAVEEGRAVYDNLRKSLVFMLPTNGGEAGMIVFAILAGMVLPVTPVQILWVNTVTAITLALALAFEAPESDVMRRPPRPPAEPILSGFVIWRIAYVSLLLVAASLGLFLWEQARGASLEAARTLAVTALVMGELFYLFNARKLTAPAWAGGIFANAWAWIAAAALVCLQSLFVHAGAMNRLFGSVPLDARAWGLAVAAGAAVFLLVEAEKALQRRFNGRSGGR